jgi:shikimate dehydrogenase
VGNPIAHSLSPVLHTAFAQQFNDELFYGRLLLTTDRFQQEVRTFFAAGGCGLNITVPFKNEAFQLCDQLTAAATAAGTVNTLWCEADQIWGDNTDGSGLVEDLRGRCGMNLQDLNLLILGAGGAVQGVITPLFEAGVERITLANRTRAKADALVDRFADKGEIDAIDAGSAINVVDKIAFDLVIHGTGAGLTQGLPALNPTWFDQQTVCYDMMYGEKPTSFLTATQASYGVSKGWDGLGMLLEQAALAFGRWRGHKPDTAKVMQQLRPDAH